MNKIILTITTIAYIASAGYSQNDTTKQNNSYHMYKVGEIQPDTSVIDLKNREILVIRNPIRKNTNKTKDTSLYHQKKKTGFKGTWTGIELGINNYLNNNHSLTIPSDAKLIDLKTFNSWEFNWNIFKKSYGIYKDKLGIVTGLGLAFNNYSFSKQVIFQKDFTPIKFTLDTTDNLKKNKLAITYLTIPIILEYRVPLCKSTLHFSAGVIGSIKLKSKIKQIDKQDNKFVFRDNYHLSPYKLEGTLRIGYGHFILFTNYSFTALFKTNQGPELYPFSFGFGFTF